MLTAESVFSICIAYLANSDTTWEKWWHWHDTNTDTRIGAALVKVNIHTKRNIEDYVLESSTFNHALNMYSVYVSMYAAYINITFSGGYIIVFRKWDFFTW